MSNDIHVYSSPKGIEDFVKSSIETSEMVLEHYEFVINDISSKISDPELEASKEPALQFLKKMRSNWADFKLSLEMQLETLEKK